MARQPSRKNRLWFQQDKSFRVIAELRPDRNNSFRVRYWFVGQSFKYFGADSETEAIEIAQRIWERHLLNPGGASEKEYKTIQELSERFYTRDHLRPKSKRFYKQSLDQFCSFVGEHRSFKRITPADIELFLSSLTCNQVSKQSKLRAVKGVFNYAIKNGLLDSSPANRFTIKTKHTIRPYLLPDEFKTFLGACKPSFYPRALFALETAARSGEIINLKWNSVFLDREKPFVVFQENKETDFQPKWGKRGAVPLSKTAIVALKQSRERWKKSEYVFSDGYLKSSSNLCRDTHLAARKAGTTDIDFHGLRRSAAVRWLMNGVPIHVVSQLLRHSSIDITVKHYGWLMTDELARHIEGF